MQRVLRLRTARKLTPEELKKQVLTEIEKDVRKFHVESYTAFADEGILPTYTRPAVLAKEVLKLSLKLVPMPTNYAGGSGGAGGYLVRSRIDRGSVGRTRKR